MRVRIATEGGGGGGGGGEGGRGEVFPIYLIKFKFLVMSCDVVRVKYC